MSVLEFPTQGDIKRIYPTTPLDHLNERIFALLKKTRSKSGGGLPGFKKALDSGEFLLQLHYRLMDVAKSYALLSCFFEKGIPDEEWHISPGKSGASIEYFPHFEPMHFEIKDWFDYFSDTFYYKFFSALDMTGHLLNVQHDLGIKKKVSFHQAVDQLRHKNKTLFEGLNAIRTSGAFKEAQRLRNDITHNYLPGSTGISVTLTPKGGGVGIREYTPSAAIMRNVREAIGLLEKIVTVVTV